MNVPEIYTFVCANFKLPSSKLLNYSQPVRLQEAYLR